MATVRKSIPLWMLSETSSVQVFFFFFFFVMHCIVVAGFYYWLEMNVNLGEAMKLIFPGN